MAMNEGYRFVPVGPFEVPVTGAGEARLIDCRPARNAVFRAAQDEVGGWFDVEEAIGLYMFALKPSGRRRVWPYYVGKAVDQSLYARSFQLGDKPKVYNAILREYGRAKPLMYLLPLFTPSGRLAQRGSSRNRIAAAEEMLIGMALQCNADLWNIQHRAKIESFAIDGISTTQGRPTSGMLALREALQFEV